MKKDQGSQAVSLLVELGFTLKNIHHDKNIPTNGNESVKDLVLAVKSELADGDTPLDVRLIVNEQADPLAIKLLAVLLTFALLSDDTVTASYTIQVASQSNPKEILPIRFILSELANAGFLNVDSDKNIRLESGVLERIMNFPHWNPLALRKSWSSIPFFDD